MRKRYRVVIVETSANGSVFRRVVRRDLYPDKAEMVLEYWTQKYRGRQGVEVVCEVDL